MVKHHWATLPNSCQYLPCPTAQVQVSHQGQWVTDPPPPIVTFDRKQGNKLSQ